MQDKPTFGETDLTIILNTLSPELNEGEYVFCSTNDPRVDLTDVVGVFRESEGLSVIISKTLADQLNLSYNTVLSWITLRVHSSLEAVGLTAAFSKALAENNISCNVVAAVTHDHIFVPAKDATRAMEVLTKLSEG